MEKNKKLKSMIIIIAIVAAGAIVAVLLFANSPSRRLTKLLDLGNRYLEACEYDQAIAAFEGALEIDPNCVEAYLGEGNAYIGLGEYDQAIAAFEGALAIDPNSVEAYLGAANAYVALEDYENAITVLEKGYELTGKGELKDQLEDIKEESKKAEEAEKPLSADEEENAGAEQAEINPYAYNSGELSDEPYPLAMQGFSDFKDEGNSFTVRTRIWEAGYLPAGKFESMREGESVNILGQEFKKMNYTDGDYQKEVLKANDGFLYFMGTKEYDDFYRDPYSFLKLDGMEQLLRAGMDGTGFFNESLQPVAMIQYDFELRVRSDAVIELATGNRGAGWDGTVPAKEVFSGQYEPSSEAGASGESSYSDSWRSFWLIFDENGMVEKLIEVSF